MTDEELTRLETSAKGTLEALADEIYMDAYGPEIATDPANDVLKLVAEVRRLQQESLDFHAHLMDAMNDLYKITDKISDEMLDKLMLRREKLKAEAANS